MYSFLSTLMKGRFWLRLWLRIDKGKMMSSLLKVLETVTTEKIFAILFALIAFHATMFEALAAPALDSSFGSGGIVRIGAPSGYDRLDTILVETSGKVVLVGFTFQTFDYLLERLMANGSPDISFGTNGRVAPRQYSHFIGKVRAAEQESGAITVVTGTAVGSHGQVGTVTAFRLDSAGTLYAGFAPALAAPAVGNTDIALGVRPDGRLLYGTTTYDGTAILQQTMPDGSPDLNFGASGKIEFPLSAGEVSRQADLVLLGDGSVVFAVLTTQNLRLYKVDSHGLPVASFGTVGQFAYAAADFANAYSIGIPFSLLSLSDGSLLAGIRNAPSGSPSGSLLVIRISSNGMLIGANNLLADQLSHLEFCCTARRQCDDSAQPLRWHNELGSAISPASE